MKSNGRYDSKAWRATAAFTTAALLSTLIPAPALAEVAVADTGAIEVEALEAMADDAQGQDGAQVEVVQDGDAATTADETEQKDAVVTVGDQGSETADAVTSLVAADDANVAGDQKGAKDDGKDAKKEDEYTLNCRIIERGWDGTQVTETERIESRVRKIPEKAELAGGWYILDTDMTYKDRLVVSGDTHLILESGKTLEATRGIYIQRGATLSVYDQGNEGGKIIAKAKTGAGIGAADDNRPGGNLIIHGGTIEAKGADHCAGIGANDGNGTEVGDFTMYGGTVTAEGGDSGAGVGGGRACEGGHISIYGGTLTATGKHYAAGIGGGNGQDKPVKGAHGGTIEIWGGTVTATGGDDGAGIGGGEGGNAGNIAIHGGTVTATGGDHSAGIGCGELESTGDGGKVTIDGGTVVAHKGGDKDGVGIGGGTRCEVNLGGEGDLSVTTDSVRGAVKLTRKLQCADACFTEGTGYDTGMLTGQLVPWDGVIDSWSTLQRSIAGAPRSNAVTLTNDLVAQRGDTSLQVTAKRPVSIDMQGHTIDRGLQSSAKDGSVFFVGKQSSLTLKGGTIQGGFADKGGAIYSEGEAVLDGVTVKGNKAAECGGAIYVDENASAVFGGNCQIMDNKVGDATSNVYVHKKGTLALLHGEIDTSSRIGVTTQVEPTAKEPAVFTQSVGDCHAGLRAFVADNKAYHVGEFDRGCLALYGESYTLSFDLDGGDGTAIEPLTVGKDGKATLPASDAVRDGKQFACWNVNGKLCAKGGKVAMTGDQVAKAVYYDCDEATYVDAEGNDQTRRGVYEITADTEKIGADGEGLWYIVKGEVNNDRRIVVEEDAHLILADGAALTAPQGIYVRESASLTIWSQKEDTGKLVCRGKVPGNCAGIGGNNYITPGPITINGGKISAEGGRWAAGIGGGNGTDGTVTITRGEVEVNGGEWGAGIGGGHDATGNVTVSGGIVKANGGNKAAGIGSGPTARRSGLVRIEGGTVRAKGGNCGSAIGTGSNDSQRVEVQISGGDVEGFGGDYAAGIGGGRESRAKTIRISGGRVRGHAGWSDGISDVPSGIGGGGWSQGGEIYILGGDVRAEYPGWGWESGLGNGAAYDEDECEGAKIYIGYDESNPAGMRLYTDRIRGKVYLLNNFMDNNDHTKTWKASGRNSKFKKASELYRKTIIPAVEGIHSIYTKVEGDGTVKTSMPTAFASTEENPVYIDVTTQHNAGFRLRGVTVTTKSSKKQIEVESHDGGYRFVMPDEDVEVKATFGEIRFIRFYDGDKKFDDQLVFKGEAGKKPADPTKPGYRFDGWHVKGKNGELAKDAYDFSAAVNGDVALYAAWTKVDAKPAFHGHQLSLGDGIGVTFEVELPETEGVNWADSYMEFKVAGKDGGTKTDAFDSKDMNKEGTCYRFTCKLNAVQMADEVCATLHYTQDGEEKTLSQTYSIKQYVEEFDSVAKNYDDDTKLLVHSVADLGHYMQPFLAADGGWTLGEGCDHEVMPASTEYGLEQIDAARTGCERFSPVVSDCEGTGIARVGVAVMLDSSTCLRSSFHTQKGVDIVGATIDGKEATARKVGDSCWCLEVEGIKAYDLDRAHDFVITMSTGGSVKVTCSALSYANALLTAKAYENNDVAHKAATAMYNYWNVAHSANTAKTK